MRHRDFAAIRERLAGMDGRSYWRSLEELAQTEEFDEFLHREFPDGASEWTDPVGRRQFLRLMGAALALGSLACTRQPLEPIVPYVRAPEEIVPGRPLFFATAMSLSGVATGLLVESHMGRPTKVEGNPLHPDSLGATDRFSQASVLGLYDPDRSQTVRYLEEIRPYSAFLGAVQAEMVAQRAIQGAGLRILTETINSPTLADQLRNLLEELPEVRWHQYEPAGRHNARAGAQLAFGEPVNTIYRFAQANVVVLLGSDALSCMPGTLRYARDFAVGRRAPHDRPEMSRVYAVEATPSPAGSAADHRLLVRPREMEGVARTLAAALGVPGVTAPADLALEPEIREIWIPALIRDLQANSGACVVVPGEYETPVVHALAHAMNAALGNVGGTVTYTDPIEPAPVDQIESLRELVRDLNAGEVDILLILGGNPVFTAPADLGFAEALMRARLRIHLSQHFDETSELCHWHAPEAHYLEAWSDARSFDGTVSIVQPLIAPLYGGRSAHEALAAFTELPDRTGYELVRDFWSRMFADGEDGAWGPMTDPEGRPFADFERFWRRALHDGVIAGTALPPRPVTLQEVDWNARPANPASAESASLEVIFRPDPTVYDGRFANNAWLQELPKPLTTLTWDNAVLLGIATAERLGIATEDVVELHYQGRSVRAAALIAPGHAPDCATVYFGYGRRRVGRVGVGSGYDGYRLRTSDAPWFGPGLDIRRTRERHRLARTQGHHNMEGRDLVRAATLAQYRENPEFAHDRAYTPPPYLTMYPQWVYEGYAWGMSIDQNACIGCNACVVACQSENNIPTVGKDQVLNHREMHWLRIDTYHAGDPQNPDTYYQPVLCQHCEKAPCEVVCPVNATVHSHEGLNEQVYNRCVGTRYCSHNCPYKVRRFNFFTYSDFQTPTLRLLRNPDVTVRTRGVMEKCTFCVQRINHARIEAKKADRPIRDGEIVMACEAACPTQAIVFGDINNPGSRVTHLKAEPRNYSLLSDLNTRPRVSYLAAVRNPHPEIEPLERRDAGGPWRLRWNWTDRGTQPPAR